jgi:solute carrier family 45, member 1/2/4
MDVQGVHNIFVVVPQILVTGLSAIIFAIFDPRQSPKGGVMPPPLPQPSSVNVGAKVIREVISFAMEDLRRDESEAEKLERGGQSNSVVYVFR